MAEIDKSRKPTKLFWVDLEMTGLDPDTNVILEVAALVTDFEFNVIDRYEAVIWQSDQAIEQSNPWSKKQHAASGLLERVRLQGRPETDVVNEITGLIAKNFGDEPAVLAGNSIHSDRGFIKKHWPTVDDMLHYRMLDVSTLKVIMQGKYDVDFPKTEDHRALTDIEASINELKYYLEWLKKAK